MTGRKQDAVRAAELGWRVIPLHWVEESYVDDLPEPVYTCSCSDPWNCHDKGKHPRIKTGKGLENASSDPVEVAQWWDRWPWANIGVACGRDSGFFVIDCDLPKAGGELTGEHHLRYWLVEKKVELPSTLSIQTGSGGLQLFFRYPEDGGERIVGRVRGWLPLVDIRSDGNYVLLPPSSHASGRSYRWQNVPETGVAEAPPELLHAIRYERLERPKRSGAGGEGESGPDYDYDDAVAHGPRAGYRDPFFNDFAFRMRKRNYPPEVAIAEMRKIWALAEQPPGDEYELRKALEKVQRVYETVEPEQISEELQRFADRLHADRQSGGQPVIVTQPVGVTIPIEPPAAIDTDLGNAWRLIRRHGDRLRWSDTTDWLLWDERIWRPGDNEVILELARDTVASMFVSALTENTEEEKRAYALKWAKKSSDAVRIKNMVKMTEAYDELKIRPHQLDADPMLLTVPNGTIELRTGEIRPHSPDDLITKMGPVPYVPEAYDERWTKFLEDVTASDQELIAYLRRAAGYTLTGATSEEAMFILFGPTASGKSTFVAAVETMLGDYAMTTQVENLMLKRNGQPVRPDEVARWRGMRLITAMEPSEGDTFAAGLLKQLAGGDRVSARQLYRQSFDFEPSHKLWLSANHQPRSNDTALLRRLRFIPFPVQIPEERRDPGLKAELRRPASPVAQAALAWAVRGAREWSETGLGRVGAVDRLGREYAAVQDLVGQFVGECLEVAPGAVEGWEIEAKQVYRAWTIWCSERGEHATVMRRLNRDLRERHGLLPGSNPRKVTWVNCRFVESVPAFWQTS